MISKINKVQNFGVFSDFNWEPLLNNFKTKNILYGWNYSGKTTLSRLFSYIEKHSIDGNPDIQFEIENSDGEKFSEKDLLTCPLQIRVFNTDFVKNNIKWDGESFQPILLLGEENIEIDKKISDNNKRKDYFKAKRQSTFLAFKDIDKTLSERKTEIAKKIRIDLKILDPFDRGHLDKIINDFDASFKDNIINDLSTLSEALRIATLSEENKLALLNPINIEPKLKRLKHLSALLLAKTPELSNTIDYLKANSEVSSWVEEGLLLHENKKTCEFCGNDLTDIRIAQLKAHFSKDLQSQKKNISDLIKELNDEKQKNIVYSENDFYPQFRSKYQRINEWFKEKETLYIEQIDIIIDLLKEKLMSPFKTSFSLLDVIDYSDDLISVCLIINLLISENNKATEYFVEIKNSNIEKLKKHFTAEFLLSSRYYEQIKRIKILRTQVSKIDVIVEKLEKINVELEASVNNVEKGKEKLNKYISEFLGRNDIKIDTVIIENKERFKLNRNNENATNLSEGEKTAIAFSYYLTKLEEDRNPDEIIVYIDDPVSSLDSNHIYHIYHLLNDNFFFFDEKEGKDGAHKSRFNQIFISTHNFELLSLLKKLPSNKTFLSSSFYEIQRISDKVSSITNMCPLFLNFESEYNYLFKLIYSHHILEVANRHFDPNMVVLPNAIRRFIESYTLLKIPSGISVDRRAKKLFGNESEEIIKFLHHHSHFERVEQIGHHDSSILMLSSACDSIIKWLETNDNQHYEALLESISE